MFKLIRGCVYVIVSIVLFFMSLDWHTIISPICFGFAILLSLSIMYDGYKEYKISENKVE